MRDIRRTISVVGLVATLVASAHMVVQLEAQQGTLTGDFRNATTAEVRDAQGQVILRGQFAAAEVQDDETERLATLTPTGVDADGAGEAEVEFTTAMPTEQEVEFSVRNLQAGAVVTFVIDGVNVASATVDQRGRAEVELDVRPGASPSR
jgi:hypothetical protein